MSIEQQVSMKHDQGRWQSLLADIIHDKEQDELYSIADIVNMTEQEVQVPQQLNPGETPDTRSRELLQKFIGHRQGTSRRKFGVC